MQGLRSVVTICAWILFIYGCVMLINTVVQSIRGDITAELTMAGGGISMVSFVLAAVAARIRQKME